MNALYLLTQLLLGIRDANPAPATCGTHEKTCAVQLQWSPEGSKRSHRLDLPARCANCPQWAAGWSPHPVVQPPLSASVSAAPATAAAPLCDDACSGARGSAPAAAPTACSAPSHYSTQMAPPVYLHQMAPPCR